MSTHESDGVRVEIDDPVATITLVRPETLNAQTNTLVTWTVTSGDASHGIRFTGNIPSGSNPNSSTISLGQKVSTTFLQAGTYNYEDSLETSHTGVIIVQ